MKSNLKKRFVAISVILALLGAALSQVFLPNIARADAPQFNIYTPYVHTSTYNQDYFLLDIKNETKGTDWNNSVSADAGDVLVFYVFYHNGIVNTVAGNTTVKVALPSGSNTQQTVTAFLWADNALNASPQSPMSQPAQVNLSSVQSLEYISGSARWFPNQVDWRTAAATAFLNGQNGSQLFGSGINIGSIEGCWEFSGAVVFKMKVSQTQYAASLKIEKTMKNLTAGQAAFSETVSAAPRQLIATQISVTNTGNAIASNAIVRDALPNYLYYNNNSTRIDGIAAGDGIATAGGINIGALAAGQTKTVYFEGTLGDETKFPVGDTTITNTAFAKADSLAEIQDSANVVVGYSGAPNLTIAKTVRNKTTNNSFAENTEAKKDEIVEFKIVIANTGNTALNNVIARDVLPAGLSYVSGSTKVDNSSASDDLLQGLNVGSLSLGGQRVITFDARVNYETNQTVTNTGYARADQVAEKNDTASVTITYVVPSVYDLTIAKTVRNKTLDYGFSENTNAKKDEIVEFKMTATNTGNAGLNNIIVRDALPSGLSYVYGSAKIDGAAASDNVLSGLDIGSLAANNQRVVTFDARVNSDFSQTVTNTGYARADQVAEKNDTASVTITYTTTPTYQLSIQKTVLNLTQGQSQFSENVNANPGDRVAFRIEARNNGNTTLNNLLIRDSLPSGLNFLSGSVRVDNAQSYDGLINSGIQIGSLAPGAAKIITFEAQVYQTAYNSATTLTNVAFGRADQTSEISDTASVFVYAPLPTPIPTVTPIPSQFNKKVENLTWPNGTFTDNSAHISDVLRYTLTYTNYSNAVLYNVQILDVMPSYAAFLNADSNGSYNSQTNAVVWSVGNLNPGANVTVSYQAKIQVVPGNNFVITNTAQIAAQNLAPINSNETHTTVVGISKPVTVVTGSNNIARNMGIAGLVSALTLFALYLAMEHTEFWRRLKLKMAIQKAKALKR